MYFLLKFVVLYANLIYISGYTGTHLKFFERVNIMKRALCFSMLVIFLVTLYLPFSASAAANSTEGALDFTSSRTKPNGNGWSWDSGSKTLTLCGLSVDASSGNSRDSVCALKLPAGSTIVLEDGSENTFVTSAAGQRTLSSYCIYSLGSLVITGEGKLSAAVTGSSEGNSFGIYALGDISILGGAEVDTAGGRVSRDSGYCSAGIYTLEHLTVSGASLTARSDSTGSMAYSYGIFSGKSLFIEDSSISAAGGKASESSCGIMCSGEARISGGSVTAAGGTANISAGICSSGTLADFSGGAEVSAFGGPGLISAGILASGGCISICGVSTGVAAMGGVSVDERSIAAAGNGELDTGLCASEINISGGTVFAGSGSAPGAAISSCGEVIISGGRITTVSNGEADAFSICGMNGAASPEKITVTGGSFNASVAQYAADSLNFEVDRGDGRFAYFETADEALEYAGADSGVTITAIGASAGLRSCSVSISLDGEGVDFTRVMPEGFTMTLPGAQTKCGYMFFGWSDGDSSYAADETVTISRSSAFVPVWGSLPSVTGPGSGQEATETPAAEFADVSEDAWYHDAVEFVSTEGLMVGVGDGNFAPEAELSRAMFWTVLARAEGVDTDDGGKWYAAAQEWATASDVSDGAAPRAAITREQLVTMLYRLYGEPGYAAELSEIPDAEAVSTWARDAMAWAVGLGLVEGDENGAICPSATATRAQAAAVLMRLAQI